MCFFVGDPLSLSLSFFLLPFARSLCPSSSSMHRSRPRLGVAPLAPPAAVPPAAQSAVHVLEQQQKFAAHLSRHITQLQSHQGSFGQLGHQLQDSSDQAKQIEHAIDTAHSEWSKRSRAADRAAATGSDPPLTAPLAVSPSLLSSAPVAPAAPGAPDLDALASSLEHLARHIAAHEAQADAQSAALRSDIARVMEVYEDPAAFLPPPLQGGPDFGGYIISSSSSSGGMRGSSGRSDGGAAATLESAGGRQVRIRDTPSEMLQQQYGSLALHHQPHLQPEPPQPLYTHTSKHTGFDYGQMSSFIRSMVRERVAEEVDGDQMTTTDPLSRIDFQ